ncbi:hypothetical protein FDP22_12520 [Paroceanicella profunda]|uniref:Uncharacterized protein n=1 Tax=Paroceanicella profunda TaxID=2579971 RepID=A0A5B8FHK2_9RHOB|nr:hypothetical protein [Paroceanicella profunda]QDL92531.1 hypothetical protein FDP22_12520 [Paroceanicella profunda]
MARQSPNTYSDAQLLRMLDLQDAGWTGKAIAQQMTREGLPMSRAGALALLNRIKRETDAAEIAPLGRAAAAQ